VFRLNWSDLCQVSGSSFMWILLLVINITFLSGFFCLISKRCHLLLNLLYALEQNILRSVTVPFQWLLFEYGIARHQHYYQPSKSALRPSCSHDHMLHDRHHIHFLNVTLKFSFKLCHSSSSSSSSCSNFSTPPFSWIKDSEARLKRGYTSDCSVEM